MPETWDIIAKTSECKVLSLWNGSGNNSPPVGWQSAFFDDSAWAPAVAPAMSALNSYGFGTWGPTQFPDLPNPTSQFTPTGPFGGAQAISTTTGSPGSHEQFLIRWAFDPALLYNADVRVGIWTAGTNDPFWGTNVAAVKGDLGSGAGGTAVYINGQFLFSNPIGGMTPDVNSKGRYDFFIGLIPSIFAVQINAQESFLGGDAPWISNMWAAIIIRLTLGDKQLWAWGHNYNDLASNPGGGQLGIGGSLAPTGTDILVPTPVWGKKSDTVQRNYVLAKTDGHVSLLLDDEGNVYTCGKPETIFGDTGQPGRGNFSTTAYPAHVDHTVSDFGPPLPPIVDIAVGSLVSWALDVDGNLWGWGYDNNGSLPGTPAVGNASRRPNLLHADVASIDASDTHSIMLRNDGRIGMVGYTAGDNSTAFGLIGDANASGIRTSDSAYVPFMSGNPLLRTITNRYLALGAGSPPAGFELPSFDDSGWTDSPPGAANPNSSTAFDEIWSSFHPTSANEHFVDRIVFHAGIAGVEAFMNSVMTFIWALDDDGEIYLNGTLIAQNTTGSPFNTVEHPTTSLINYQGDNVLALYGRNNGGTYAYVSTLIAIYFGAWIYRDLPAGRSALRVFAFPLGFMVLCTNGELYWRGYNWYSMFSSAIANPPGTVGPYTDEWLLLDPADRPSGTLVDCFGGNGNLFFVMADGSIHGRGYNAYGQLGRGFTSTYEVNTAPVIFPGGFQASHWPRGGSSSISFIAKGVDNSIYTWGYGGEGEMGNFSTTASNPTPLLLNFTAPSTGWVNYGARNMWMSGAVGLPDPDPPAGGVSTSRLFPQIIG